MNKPKYYIDENVYITNAGNIIEGIVKEIHITETYIIYKIRDKQKDYYLFNMEEDEVFKTKEDVQKFIQKRDLISKIDQIEGKILDYQEWVSQLDKAIRNYESCETHITVKLLSNQTNGKDEKLISVINTSSKNLLEYLQKYYKEELEERENILEKLKKEKEAIKV